MKDAGAKLRTLRNGLGLTQKQFGQVIQVDSNTYAKWERQAKVPEGANKKKVTFLLELAEIEKLKEVLSKTVHNEGNIPAAGLFGLLYGLWSASGIPLASLWPELSRDSNWMIGVFKLIQKVTDNKEGLNDQFAENRRRDSTFT